MTEIALALLCLLIAYLAHRALKKREASPEEVDSALNRIDVLLDACVYIEADDGKDTVVNRHLQKRADHLEQHYEKMAKRAKRRK
jgi:hypothetical protein